MHSDLDGPIQLRLERGMDALLFLLLAAILTWLRRGWLSLAAVPLAALAGTTLPDLDLALSLGHRSGLTHSILPVALACVRPGWRPVAAGLALGIGLHLSADVFPNGMRGFATVKLPGAGSIGAAGSYAWLAVNALASLGLGTALLLRLTSARWAALVLLVVAAIGMGYLYATDGGWPALLVFTGAGWALLRRDRQRVVQRMR